MFRMAAALRLKVGVPLAPVMPGAAACAANARSDPSATGAPPRTCQSSDCVFVARIAALLDVRASFGLGVDRTADVDLGHQSTEILGVVRQMIELGCVEIKLLAL